MTYRDDLGAARAKIEVLEEQLRELREEKERAEAGAAAPPVPDDAVPLELAPLPEDAAPTVARSPEQVQVGLAALEKIEALREAPARAPPARARRKAPTRVQDLPTLLEHNARAPQHVLRSCLRGPPRARVVCPVCVRDGQRVELHALHGSTVDRLWKQLREVGLPEGLRGQLVACGRCGLWAIRF